MLPLSDLIPIPETFKAYVKSDTVFHGLKGECVVLLLEESYNFFDFKQDRNKCLWFLSNAHGIPAWVPNGDIDFSTIKLIEDPTPSMPTLETTSCSIPTTGGAKVFNDYSMLLLGEAIARGKTTSF